MSKKGPTNLLNVLGERGKSFRVGCSYLVLVRVYFDQQILCQILKILMAYGRCWSGCESVNMILSFSLVSYIIKDLECSSFFLLTDVFFPNGDYYSSLKFLPPLLLLLPTSGPSCGRIVYTFGTLWHLSKRVCSLILLFLRKLAIVFKGLKFKLLWWLS